MNPLESRISGFAKYSGPLPFTIQTIPNIIQVDVCVKADLGIELPGNHSVYV